MAERIGLLYNPSKKESIIETFYTNPILTSENAEELLTRLEFQGFYLGTQEREGGKDRNEGNAENDSKAEGKAEMNLSLTKPVSNENENNIIIANTHEVEKVNNTCDCLNDINVQENQWNSISKSIMEPAKNYHHVEFGGIVRYILIDPNDNNIVYLASAGSVFKTTRFFDPTPHWKCLTDNLLINEVSKLAFGRTTSTIYLVTGPVNCNESRFYWSNDSGETWHGPGKGLPTFLFVISEIIVDTKCYSKEDVILLGTSNSIYRSNDSGRNFKQINGGLFFSEHQGVPEQSKIPFIETMLSTDRGIIASAGYGNINLNPETGNPTLGVRSNFFNKSISILYLSKDTGKTWKKLVDDMDDPMYNDPNPYLTHTTQPVGSGSRSIPVNDPNIRVGDFVFLLANLFTQPMGRVVATSKGQIYVTNLIPNLGADDTDENIINIPFEANTTLVYFHISYYRATRFSFHQKTSKLYALCGGIMTTDPLQGTDGYGQLKDVLVSKNMGKNWVTRNVLEQKMTTTGTDGKPFITSVSAWFGNQYSYTNIIIADPFDKSGNTLYIGALNLLKSLDGGRTWEIASFWSTFYPLPSGKYVHADFHASVIFKSGHTKYTIFGNDAGISISTDDGKTYSTLKNRHLASLLVYQVSSSAEYEHTFGHLIGLQDNGSNWIKDVFKDKQYVQVSGGDGFGCALSQTSENDKSWAMTTIQNSFYASTNALRDLDPKKVTDFYFKDTADALLSDFQQKYGIFFSTMVVLPPSKDPTGNVAYVRDYNSLEKWIIDPSTNPVTVERAKVLSAGIRKHTILEQKADIIPMNNPFDTVQIAPSSFHTIANNYSILSQQEIAFIDALNVLWVTENEGDDWTYYLTLPPTILPDFDAYASCLMITRDVIIAGNKNPYISDGKNIIVKSVDGGKTWTDVSNGLAPLTFTFHLIVHPNNNNIVFVGTSRGVYISLNQGTSWNVLGTGLPISINSTNIYIYPGAENLLVGTFGRGVWQLDISNLNKQCMHQQQQSDSPQLYDTATITTGQVSQGKKPSHLHYAKKCTTCNVRRRHDIYLTGRVSKSRIAAKNR